MNSFTITTVGCKVNQYESQQIRELLNGSGLTQVSLKERPDLVIINSCCVTHSASAKSRQYIQRAQKLNPQALIVICGCLATISVSELGDVGKNVCVIKHRNSLTSTLKNIICEKKSTTDLSTTNTLTDTHIKTEIAHKIKAKNDLDNNLGLPLLRSFKGHTRAFLKIQDGCDGYCSYCIIPRSRPDVHCKTFVKVIKEARALVDSGHKEIVLTGVFLGAYGQETVIRKKWPGGRNDRLAELLEELAQVSGLERVRLSSLEPGDVTERLLDVFCNYRNIMPHLHLSLQSGSDEILKKMRRQYSSGQFEEKVEMIKERLQVPAITGDIIVGFPGETEEDFEKTLFLAQKTGFSKMHVFGFSAREGTAAGKMQGLVNTGVMKKRTKRMHRLDEQLQREFRQMFVNKEVMVLMERDGYGRCERYFKVYVDDKSLKANDLVKVRITGDREDGAEGVLVSRCSDEIK
ncbi:MAG: tRNA (N(6)-L-threonylcarbamoyladenosine(37)-C(2))-methylthiotransferase MtaB [Planctomycetota bacterium]|jgi:threonylcarbamoyladenosine tRNA methylthiotransferase MtaB